MLENLKGVPFPERKGRFTCVIAVATPDGKTDIVKGICDGYILEEMRGTGGFGYDCLFFIEHIGKTLAEINLKTKNMISHRGIALRNLKLILPKYIMS